ncbi:hypothetical protein SH1V18_35070 [Vallitalea longa]|uniref:Uncharacterized protein n=1 Tax=Vallitalea longa TaxID=2936439 RepID=A0A9W5YBN1_9FIRM|nr:hypothetical protein [Vallitalea longa]GKX31027.1 hypothetical protein SH1V18_35070 [Vallitalea longa]
MLSQDWIVNSNSTLFSVSHWPHERAEVGVVLVAGFSQPMCDIDYFMSKMARHMNKKNLYVLQVDPRGHGDSPGYLENITIEDLREDLFSAICHARNNISDKIYCVGRGLSATLFSEFLSADLVQGVAGINPYWISNDIVRKISNNVSTEVIEAADFFNENNEDVSNNIYDDKASFLVALGANKGNLFGQKLSASIIEDLTKFNAIEKLKSYTESTLWFFYSEQCSDHIVRWDCLSDLNDTIDKNHCDFVRDPLWQYNVIDRICSWILEQ